MDEYDKTEEEINTLIITIYSGLLIHASDNFSTVLATQNPSIFDQQFDWANFDD
jgi:hypothetical protein